MEKLINQLQNGNCSLVLKSADGTVTQYFRQGVLDLYWLLMRSPAKLKGAWVADKVVGKGAAALMVKGGVTRVHAILMSRFAIELFERHQVVVSYDTMIERVFNHHRTGPCPVESLCIPLTDISDMYKAIKGFINQSSLLSNEAAKF